MTAPVGRDVGKGLEPVGNTVVDFFLVRIRLGVGFADALGDHAGVAFGVAGVLAVFALHAGRVLQEVATQGTAHDVVELLGNELVALFLVDFLLLLANGTLTVETDIERSAVLQLLGYSHI